jgi:hypothetical protein
VLKGALKFTPKKFGNQAVGLKSDMARSALSDPEVRFAGGGPSNYETA